VLSYHSTEGVQGFKAILLKGIAVERQVLPAEDMATGCSSRILAGTETESAFALATGRLNIRQHISTGQQITCT
jgi:hypothetical protein